MLTATASRQCRQQCMSESLEAGSCNFGTDSCKFPSGDMGTQKLHFAPRSPKMGDFELQLFQFVDGNFLTNENFPAGSNLGGQLSFPRCHGITERSWKHYDCLSSVHPPLDVVVAAAARMNVGNFFHRKSYQEGKADMSKCLGLPSLRPLVSAD